MALPRTDADGWWWDKTKHPVLWELVMVCVAIAMLVWAAMSPHGFFSTPTAPAAIIASLVVLAVVGRRAVRWLARR
jgi:hypothetical protein